MFIAALGGGNKRRERKGDRRESDEIQLKGVRVRVFIKCTCARKCKQNEVISVADGSFLNETCRFTQPHTEMKSQILKQIK